MSDAPVRAISEVFFEDESAKLGSLTARYTALMGISNLVGTDRSTLELCRSLAVQLEPLARFDLITLQLYDEVSNSFHRYISEDAIAPRFTLPLDIPTEETGAWWVYERQQPLAIPYIDRETRFRRIISALRKYGVRSDYLVPLTTAHRRLGSIAFTSRRSEILSNEEIQFLSVVAKPVALAVESALVNGRWSEENSEWAHGLAANNAIKIRGEEIVGQSAALHEVMAQVQLVAPTSASVMIYGETGTGKELIAREIHNRSPRHSNPFVEVNCAAIPTGLLESELFGHEKGAFTGAITRRIGRFELADHGTLFLDEIAEIPLDIQPKLLRVLQAREFERLGSGRTIRTDARLITATNEDLSIRVGQKAFRSDLYFRLNVFPIRVPPLRERRDDIPLLAQHFVSQFSRRMNKKIATIPYEVLCAMVEYDWPGNIRELQNVIERAVILSSGRVLRLSASEIQVRSTPSPINRDSGLGHAAGIREVLQEVERERMLEVLEQSHWIISGPTGAAARLGLNRSTLQFRMRKLGISRTGK